MEQLFTANGAPESGVQFGVLTKSGHTAKRTVFEARQRVTTILRKTDLQLEPFLFGSGPV
jgi:hypothetical protein